MRTGRHRSPVTCPVCRHELDGWTNTAGKRSPEPGDWNLCFDCAAMLRFDRDSTGKLILRELRDDEEPPAALVKMQRMRAR